MKKLYFLFALCFLFVGDVLAQQQAMFTQYMFNGLLLNPAYAGSHESISITAAGRRQWVGFDGAPKTETLSIHAPVRRGKVGLGAYFINDRLGVTNENSFFATASYRIRLNKGYVSMGLQFGVLNHRSDFNKLNILDETDPNLLGTVLDIFKPNVGAGIYYNSTRFYVGLSVPHLITNRFTSNDGEIVYNQARHYFLTAGYVFNMTHFLKFKPSVLVKAVEGAPIQADLNANFLLNDVLWVGGGYRSFDSFHLMTQLQLTNQFAFGYTYDMTVTDLRTEHGGTHEIMLNYRFNFNRKKIVTPRYF